MKQAPHFTLLDQNANPHSLKDYAGSWLVLYFYPKDDTPGCVTEACSIRDEYSDIKKHASILAINKGSVESHKKFADKYHLTFPVLSDTDHLVTEAYDSWKPMKFAGKEYMGTQRNTFIINPQGAIVKEYRNVTPKNHALEIIKDLEQLQQ